jgi:hypothetical protein
LRPRLRIRPCRLPSARAAAAHPPGASSETLERLPSLGVRSSIARVGLVSYSGSSPLNVGRGRCHATRAIAAVYEQVGSDPTSAAAQTVRARVRCRAVRARAASGGRRGRKGRESSLVRHCLVAPQRSGHTPFFPGGPCFSGPPSGCSVGSRERPGCQ